MSTIVETGKAVVGQPQKEGPAVQKPVKEKKAIAPLTRKPKSTKTAAHPPYFQMIKEALLSLNERTGSSPQAIAKSIEEKHKSTLPVNFRKIMGLQLKNFSTKGKLIKIKASYKLSDAGTKKKVSAVKKPAVANAETRKKKAASQPKKRATEATKKKVAAAKPVKKATQTKKRAAPATSKPKQPKSIKFPAAKKAKKAAA